MNDRITKLDKLDALRNEQRKRKGKASGASTYLEQSLVDLNLEGGRYGGAGPSVVGRTKAVEYPAASSPWQSGADPGLEPPTGVAIDAMEPVGEQFEINKSIAEQEIGEPELGAITHPACQINSPVSSVESSGSPPKLAGGVPALVITAVPDGGSSPASVERHQPSAIDAPADGLDVARRADGTPLSSFIRRKL